MKRSLLLLALASMGASTAMAQSSVTLYGRVNTTVESQKDVAANGRLTVMQNNSSRWGLKGSEDLGGGLKANFKLESGFASDTGAQTGGGIFARESWVGVAGGFGDFKMGNLTPVTALYYATSDYIGMHNHETGTSSDAFYLGAGNVRNAMSYTTPSFGGLAIELQYGLKETKAAGTKDTFVVVANYDAGPLHLGGGYASGPTTVGTLTAQEGKEWGIRGLYEMGPVVVGATYIANEAEAGGVKAKRDAARVSAMYALGSSEFHLNVGAAGKFKVGGVTVDNSDAIQYTVGYNYNLSKRTKVYGFYSAVRNKDNAAYNTYAAGKDPSFLAAGIRHNF
jgi:predicted porin